MLYGIYRAPSCRNTTPVFARSSSQYWRTKDKKKLIASFSALGVETSIVVEAIIISDVQSGCLGIISDTEELDEPFHGLDEAVGILRK